MMDAKSASNRLQITHKLGGHEEISYIKALAILSVVLLHSFPKEFLLKILAPFHIWQAVPIFFIIGGLNRSLSTAGNKCFSLSNEYSVDRMGKTILKLLIPFTIIWLIELTLLIAERRLDINVISIAILYLQGGLGPGSYFIPVFFQFLLVFPLFYWVINRYRTVGTIALFIFFIILEYGCRVFNVSDSVYRVLFFRYAGAAILGIYATVYGFKSKVVLAMLSTGSIIYIYNVSYVTSDLAPHKHWLFQNSFAYFYTTLLFFLLWKVYGKMKCFAHKLLLIGDASYHIFLIQMAWFYFAAPHALTMLTGKGLTFLYPLINLTLCTSLGLAFMALISRNRKQTPSELV